MSYQEAGASPSVRLITHQTVWAGCPSLHSRTRLRANSYAIGPVVPSETVRRYPQDAPSSRAVCATARAGLSGAAATRFVHVSPRYLSVCLGVARGGSQPRVSSGRATHATVPTHASQAVQNS